jgi:hypothetical protein
MSMILTEEAQRTGRSVRDQRVLVQRVPILRRTPGRVSGGGGSKDQYTKSALPFTLLFETGPQKRLSYELSRLSPIAK